MSIKPTDSTKNFQLLQSNTIDTFKCFRLSLYKPHKQFDTYNCSKAIQ